MPCYHPITAWPSIKINKTLPSGRHVRSMVFQYNPSKIFEPDPDGGIELSCGQCVGCRLQRSISWALRCHHEASTHEHNSFLTLTYNNESLNTRKHDRTKKEKPFTDNPTWSLDQKDNQLFMKRLRKKYGRKIKFYHCGEYGDFNGRPHYHSLLFNFDFEDKLLLKTTDAGHPLYVSEILEGTKLFKENYLDPTKEEYSPQFRHSLNPKFQKGLWPHGKCILGDVTFQSAAYVARYLMKKINGKDLKIIDPETGLYPYEHFNDDTGEITTIKPEYTTMSNGIGQKWFEQYHKDVYPSDFVIINNKKVTAPKYYDKLLLELDPFKHDRVKENRIKNINKNHKDLSPARLNVRELIKLIKIESLVRNHDLQES